jgi:quinol monooxygenase YgiN
MSASDNVAAIFRFKVAEGKLEEAEQVLAELVTAATEEEAATLVYAVHRLRDEPRAFVLYELYAGEEGFAAHAKGDRMKAAGARLAPLMEGRGDVVFLRPLEAKGLPLR